MEVKISGPGITRIADISDYLALPDEFAWRKAINITLEMGIIKHELLICTQLIDGCSAAVTLEKFYDFSISSGDNWGSGWSRDIDCVMDTSFGARVSKGVE